MKQNKTNKERQTQFDRKQPHLRAAGQIARPLHVHSAAALQQFSDVTRSECIYVLIYLFTSGHSHHPLKKATWPVVDSFFTPLITKLVLPSSSIVVMQGAKHTTTG